MPELLADVNAGGHLNAIIAVCGGEYWRDFWASLQVTVRTFDEIGLDVRARDDVVWQVCQERGILLVTGNRNEGASDSLEATLLARNTVTSLPVLTLANPDRLITDHTYAEQAAMRLMDVLLYLDDYRGSGRLWLP
jgi:hypothetical protein